MEAPELLIAFRGTNFSRRTSSDPSQGGFEPYFARSHPSVSHFLGGKNMVRTRIGSIFGIGQLGVGSLSLALWGARQHLPLPGNALLDHFWLTFGSLLAYFGFWTIAGFLPYCCPIVGPIAAPIVALMLPYCKCSTSYLHETRRQYAGNDCCTLVLVLVQRITTERKSPAPKEPVP